MFDFETFTLEEYIKNSQAEDVGTADANEMPNSIAAGFLSNIYSTFKFDEDGNNPLWERAKKDTQVAGYYKTALKKAIDMLDASILGG